MKTTPDNQKLLDLIGQARKGKIVLPQFQRNFVWGRDDITDLLVSILQGHFSDEYGSYAMRTNGFRAFLNPREMELLQEIATQIMEQVASVLCARPTRDLRLSFPLFNTPTC